MNSNTMNFLFPNITAGYLGFQQNQSTLNAAFYAELFSENTDFNQPIVFPQRVPQTEFFEEITLLEENHISSMFQDHQQKLITKLNDTHISLSKNNPRIFLNWLNLLLRYGMTSIICKLTDMQISPYLEVSDHTEFALIKEIALFRSEHSKPNVDASQRLLRLAHKILSCSELLSKRIQILTLNYIIVTAYRFRIKLSYENCLKTCCFRLVNLIEESSQIDFASVMRTSVAYRGLAMVSELALTTREDYLIRAEFFARNINPQTKREEIIAKENLYTCLQSRSKWHQNLNQFELAKSTLQEMIRLDPYDSTGYGELGFLLIDQNCVEEAADNFLQASQLGPPAVGMHTYYYAKTQQLLGNREAAIEHFYKATQIDKEAVSPWLDLIEYHLEDNQMDKAKEIISLLLKNSVYRNQLEEDETKRFLAIAEPHTVSACHA